jgi:hypothetical protein
LKEEVQKLQIQPPQCSPSAQLLSSASCEQNGYYAAQDLALLFWPRRSPDLTPCDFFLWGFVNETLYVPHLPTTLDDLKEPYQICSEFSLLRLWDEFSYRLDVVRAAGAGQIERF